MNREEISTAAIINCVPRTHGDEPDNLTKSNKFNGVFPVLTGMNWLTTSSIYSPLGVPRTHGDEPDWSELGSTGFCVFPVLTGMNRLPPPWPRGTVGVPRTHGDEPLL